MAAALKDKVTVTENGKRRQVTKREAVIAQLVNKSASAELRATKMLIDMRGDRRGSPIAWFAKGLPGQPRRGRGKCQREINSLTWYKTARPAKEEVSEEDREEMETLPPYEGPVPGHMRSVRLMRAAALWRLVRMILIGLGAFAGGIGVYAGSRALWSLLVLWWPWLFAGVAAVVALGAWWLWWRLLKPRAGMSVKTSSTGL